MKKTLVEFGLSDKEATVYLALLELEVATVQEVTKKTGLNRSSIYVVLEMLQKRGLVSISGDKSVRKYIATPPEVLLRNAEDRASSQENILKKIEAIIPEMKALHKDTKQRPIVKIFEGKEGLISAFEDSLNCKDKFLRVASTLGNIFKILPDYVPNYVKKRIALGIRMHGIHPYDEFAKMMEGTIPNFQKFDKAMFIPVGSHLIPEDIAIYDNKIGLMSAENGGFAIIIESKKMNEAMKSIFDLAWEEAKRLNKEIKKNK